MVNPREPLWLSAAAVVAARMDLAPQEAFAGFAPRDRDLAVQSLASLRLDEDRPASGAHTTEESLKKFLAPLAEAINPLPGGCFLARWMRSLPADVRVKILRGMRPETLDAVMVSVSRAKALTDTSMAAWIMRTCLRVLGRLPSATECTGVLYTLVDKGLATPLGVRVERDARLYSHGGRCRELALEVLG